MEELATNTLDKLMGSVWNIEYTLTHTHTHNTFVRHRLTITACEIYTVKCAYMSINLLECDFIKHYNDTLRNIISISFGQFKRCLGKSNECIASFVWKMIVDTCPKNIKYGTKEVVSRQSAFFCIKIGKQTYKNKFAGSFTIVLNHKPKSKCEVKENNPR